jgi:hypothetical protein
MTQPLLDDNAKLELLYETAFTVAEELISKRPGHLLTESLLVDALTQELVPQVYQSELTDRDLLHLAEYEFTPFDGWGKIKLDKDAPDPPPGKKGPPTAGGGIDLHTRGGILGPSPCLIEFKLWKTMSKGRYTDRKFGLRELAKGNGHASDFPGFQKDFKKLNLVMDRSEASDRLPEDVSCFLVQLIESDLTGGWYDLPPKRNWAEKNKPYLWCMDFKISPETFVTYQVYDAFEKLDKNSPQPLDEGKRKIWLTSDLKTSTKELFRTFQDKPKRAWNKSGASDFDSGSLWERNWEVFKDWRLLLSKGLNSSDDREFRLWVWQRMRGA